MPAFNNSSHLYVAESGPSTGEAIVFLHGGGLGGRMWQPQVDAFPDYHCIVPDLPEQGRSLHHGPFTLDGAAEDVATIIRELVPCGKAHIVGLSLGGAVALTLLRLVPETVDHVIVSGTAAGLGKVLGTLSKASGLLYRVLPTDTLLHASLKQFHVPPHYHDLVVDDLLQSMNATFTTHFTDALMTMQLPQTTTAPTLVAVGARETFPAKQAARRITRTLRGARMVVVPGVGHLWNLEAPDLFTAMVRAWITDDQLPAALEPGQ